MVVLPVLPYHCGSSAVPLTATMYIVDTTEGFHSLPPPLQLDLIFHQGCFLTVLRHLSIFSSYKWGDYSSAAKTGGGVVKLRGGKGAQNSVNAHVEIFWQMPSRVPTSAARPCKILPFASAASSCKKKISLFVTCKFCDFWENRQCFIQCRSCKCHRFFLNSPGKSREKKIFFANFAIFLKNFLAKS